MPETDPQTSSTSHPDERAPQPGEIRNLPAVIPTPSAPGNNGNGWLARLMRLFGWKPGTARSDLAMLLAAGATESGFSPEESAMLRNILALHERRVADVMVPRADVIAVQKDISLGELVKVFESAGHSRLVVYDDTLDDPVGMVHIRDLIAFMTKHAAVTPAAKSKRKKPFPADLDLRAIDLSQPLSSTNITREILFVPPSMPAIDLLAKMQTSHIHLALVIDEYGGSDGLVSIEDVVELIVGDIEDEHDADEEPGVEQQPDGTFIADSRATLEDVVAAVGTEFDVGEAAEEVDTLGGYLATVIGRVPLRGELVPGPGQFEIEVLDADPRRVKKLKIYRSRARPTRSREGRRRPGETEQPSAATATSGPDAASSNAARRP